VLGRDPFWQDGELVHEPHLLLRRPPAARQDDRGRARQCVGSEKMFYKSGRESHSSGNFGSGAGSGSRFSSVLVPDPDPVPGHGQYQTCKRRQR